MEDTNIYLLKTLEINDKKYSLQNCWEQLGLTKDYMLALLSRDEYTPIATSQPTESDTIYTDPASGNLAGFHPGQCVIYPDEDASGGIGLSVAKHITYNADGFPIKVLWFHATDLEKRIGITEEKLRVVLDGVFGSGKWLNDYPWLEYATWKN